MKTFYQILELEPRLKEITDYCKKPERKNEDWVEIYSCVKKKFVKLVGWGAEKPELKNSNDYETFIKYLVEIIWENSAPDCVKIEEE